MNHDAFRQGADAVRRFWKDAGREGAPFLSLRIPILIDGVHRPAVDMGLLRGRHTLNGSAKQIADELRGFKALGCGHVALEVSYSTLPGDRPRRSTSSPRRFDRTSRIERARRLTRPASRRRQGRRDPGERAEAAQRALGVGRVERGRSPRVSPAEAPRELTGADQHLHARRGLVVRELPLDRAGGAGGSDADSCRPAADARRSPAIAAAPPGPASPIGTSLRITRVVATSKAGSATIA